MFTDPRDGTRYRHSRNHSNGSYLKSFDIVLVLCKIEKTPRDFGWFLLVGAATDPCLVEVRRNAGQVGTRAFHVRIRVHDASNHTYI